MAAASSAIPEAAVSPGPASSEARAEDLPDAPRSTARITRTSSVPKLILTTAALDPPDFPLLPLLFPFPLPLSSALIVTRTMQRNNVIIRHIPGSLLPNDVAAID